MRTFTGQTFEQFKDKRGWFNRTRPIYENIAFDACKFENCYLLAYPEVEKRAIVRRVALRNCSWERCNIGNAILEDVLVDSLRCDDRFSLGMGGPLLKHVVIRGAVNRLILSPIRSGTIPAVTWRQSDNDVAIQSDEQFYADVDWALDIREAKFRHVRILGIPSRLIRRDPETQVVITRRRVSLERWLGLLPTLEAVRFTDLVTAVDSFVRGNEPEELLFAAQLAKDFRLQAAAIEELRRFGLVEPD